MMTILSAFTVFPKKTFFGLDKSKGHCFTLRKATTESYIQFFNLQSGQLQKKIFLVTDNGEYSATLRLVIQDKSKPNKIGISRPWKNRRVLSMGWKGNQETIAIMREGLQIAFGLVERGLKNNRQCVNFEHLGGNRFFVSFSSVYV